MSSSASESSGCEVLSGADSRPRRRRAPAPSTSRLRTAASDRNAPRRPWDAPPPPGIPASDSPPRSASPPRAGPAHSSPNFHYDISHHTLLQWSTLVTFFLYDLFEQVLSQVYLKEICDCRLCSNWLGMSSLRGSILSGRRHRYPQ